MFDLFKISENRYFKKIHDNVDCLNIAIKINFQEYFFIYCELAKNNIGSLNSFISLES